MKKLFSIALVAFGLACAVRAQSIPLVFYPFTNSVTGTNQVAITNGATGIATAASYTLNTQPFQIWRGRGVPIALAVYCTNASGSNVNFTVRFAQRHKLPSGTLTTNWITSGTGAPLTFNFANTGTTETFFFTNVPNSVLDNVDLGQFTTITNNHLSTLFLDPTNSGSLVFP